MSQTVSANGLLDAKITVADTVDGSTINDVYPIKYEIRLTSGTGTGKIQKHWHERVTIAAGGNTTISIGSDSDREDRFGNVIEFTKIRTISLAVVTPAEGKRVDVGAAAANVLKLFLKDDTDKIEVRDFLFIANTVDGWAVGNTTQNLKFWNPGSVEVVFDISVTGE